MQGGRLLSSPTPDRAGYNIVPMGEESTNQRLTFVKVRTVIG